MKCFLLLLGGLFLSAWKQSHAKGFPSWEEVYEINGAADVEGSLEFVESCPVSYYFDTQKGFFRIGMIPDLLNETYASYLKTIPRAFKSTSGEVLVEPALSVDVTAVYDHMLPVIQHLANKSLSISNQLDRFTDEKKDFALKIIRIAKSTGKEWRTANEIKAAREVLAARREGVVLKHQYVEDLHLLKQENSRLKFDKRKAMRDEHHARLLELRSEFETELVSLRHQRQQESIAFSKTMQRDKYAEKERQLELDFAFAREQLQNEINMSIDAIRFRSQEESRVERENEAVALALMRTSGELQVQRVQAVMDAFFIEVETRFMFLFEDPKLVGIGALAFVALLGLAVVMSEIFNSGKLVLKAFWRRDSLLTQVGTVSAASSGSYVAPMSSSTSLFGDQTAVSKTIRSGIVVSPELEERFIQITMSVLLSRSTFATGMKNICFLPNVLIYSAHGNGKSTAAKMLVEASGVDYAVVSGTDLRAHGEAADRTLRNVLEACEAKSKTKNKQFVLVIDDVDAIALSYLSGIGTRSPATPTSARKKTAMMSGSYKARIVTDIATNVTPSMKSCIHLLLNTFKNNSIHLGLIVTSSAPVETLNEALLDRMDHILCIDYPTTEQRLICCLRETETLLFKFMGSSDQDKFKKLVRSVFEEKNYSIVIKESVSSDSSEPELAPEVQVPKQGKKKKETTDRKSSRIRKVSVAEDSQDEQRDFDIAQCISALVSRSTNWSYRDITKTLQSIQCEVLGTDKCILTSSIWEKELNEAIQKWHR